MTVPPGPTPAPDGPVPDGPAPGAPAPGAPGTDAAFASVPRRARELAGLVVVLALVVVAFATVGVVNQLTQPGGAVAVTIDDPSLAELRVDELPPGTHVDVSAARDGVVTSGGQGSLDAGLVVDELPMWLRGLTEVPALVGALLWAVGAVILRRLLLDVARGRPFATANVGRLRALGVIVVAVALVPRMLSSGVTVATFEHLDLRLADTPIGFTILNLPLTPLVGAALLFLVAQVVRYGAGLVDEVEGLV